MITSSPALLMIGEMRPVMHLNKLPALALASILTACVLPPPVVMTTHFNAADVAWAKAKGTNELSGQGFLRQQGGNVVTCTREEVDLVPVAPYSSERNWAANDIDLL